MHVYDRKGLVVRLIYLAIAIVWWLITVGGRLSRTRVVTLCYHGVTADQRERFEKQMSFIVRRAISTNQIFTQRKTLTDRPAVCITFDDAFVNLLDNALPITNQAGIPVIVFAVTNNMGSTPCWKIDSDHPEASEVTMTSEQLESASNEPLCTIASHSDTHPRFTELTEDAAKHELTQSKAILEDITSESVQDFAFPHGACNEQLIHTAFESGYCRVFTLGYSDANQSEDQQIITRMKMTPDVWRIEFLLTVAGAYSWIYLLRQISKWLLYRTSDSSGTQVLESQVPRT